MTDIPKKKAGGWIPPAFQFGFASLFPLTVFQNQIARMPSYTATTPTLTAKVLSAFPSPEFSIERVAAGILDSSL